MISAIILATQNGSMQSKQSLHLHKVLDKPIIEHVVDSMKATGIQAVATIVDPKAEDVQARLRELGLFMLTQTDRLSESIRQAVAASDSRDLVLVTDGHRPLIQKSTYQRIVDEARDNDVVVLSCGFYQRSTCDKLIEYRKDDHTGIAKGRNSDREKESHIGVASCAIRAGLLRQCCEQLNSDNVQHEHYMEDLIRVLEESGHRVKTLAAVDEEETRAVCDRVDLYRAGKWLQRTINYEWMQKGVTFIDPEATFIGPDVEMGIDNIIYPNTTIEGRTVIGEGNIIRSGCTIINSTIQDHNTIDNARITDSVIGSQVHLGPWVHLRNHCRIEDGTRIGNFVEFKNTEFGATSRCAHLTYCGDATIGRNVNIGCGTVTVNYDGVNKWRTTIEDDVFIGCNANLIAPVTIKKRAVVAAGTTVTNDVEAGDMAIGRARQENKPGYGIKYMEKEKVK